MAAFGFGTFQSALLCTAWSINPKVDIKVAPIEPSSACYEDLKAMMKCERQKEEPGEMIQRHIVNSILKKASISQDQVI